jgi:hypothetical protein
MTDITRIAAHYFASSQFAIARMIGRVLRTWRRVWQ